MELNYNDAAVCAEPTNPQAGTTSAGEIDLYDELIAFAKLSPDEQSRLVDHPESLPADTAGELPFHEPLQTHAPIEPVESETAAAVTEAATAEGAEEHTSREPVPAPALIESVEAEAAPEIETPSEQGAEEHTSPEPVVTQSPIETVESATSVAAAESDSEVSTAYDTTTEVRPLPVEGPRPSGPLSGLNLTPDFVFTGALSRGVCLACGAESGTDDLFCLTCGVFIDEIASTLPVNPTCGECRQLIAADEIFCPWCGSVVSLA